MGLLVLQIIFDQSVERLTSNFRSGKEQSVLSIFLIFFFLLLSEFVVGNILLLFTASEIQKARNLGAGQPSALSAKTFEQILIEEIRAAGQILSGFLLFIFPGFNRLIHYFFVPFVVIFDEDYQIGKVDALKASLKVSLHHFWFLSTLLTLTSVIDWILGYLIKGDEDSIFKDPAHVGLAAAVALLLNLFFKLFYCFVYLNLKNKPQMEK